ncbi:MAG TPA: SRPBCC family protein [Chitinophagaceae bacterium]|nr:SRPBCC family protein [Chitinophagaceae bacterium]
MRFIKRLAILLLAAIGIATIVVLVIPSTQRIERTIIIQAPPSKVYDYLTRFENFDKWSGWKEKDPVLKSGILGVDGTLGAIYNWSGDDQHFGEGKMEITSLRINKEIEHYITLLRPKPKSAKSEFDLGDVDGQTRLTWRFEMDNPRPRNLSSLFNRMDSKLGKDLEEGLKNLKTTLESKDNTSQVKNYEVVPVNFQATQYLAIRKEVKMADISNLHSQYLTRIYTTISHANITPGIPAALYFNSPGSSGLLDMAAAVEVAEGTILENDSIQLIKIPGSKALNVDYYGSFDQFAHAYASLEKYLVDQGLRKKFPVIEQYLTDPGKEKDISKWHTRIILLVE